MRKVGIFGGTFDPFHRGHLHLVSSLIPLFDQLLVIPAGDPWQKETKPRASGADRVAMCELAISELPEPNRVLVTVDDREVRRPGETYSIDTVEELRQEMPDAQFTLIIGSDAAKGLRSWKRIESLATMAQFLIVTRPHAGDNGFRESVASIPGIRYDQVAIDALPISSTHVRDDAATGKNLSHVVTPSVKDYIRAHQLYADHPNQGESS